MLRLILNPMTYVALLRGINVGGNNKINMAELKTAFEVAGFKNVTTYINSGNVLFTDTAHSAAELILRLESTILKQFGLNVKVLLRDLTNIKLVVDQLPASWKNDTTTKCDVMFLWEEYDSPTVLDSMKINPQMEDVKYIAGAILWRIDRENLAKSNVPKIIGTKLAKNITARNCNSVRAMYQIMQITG